MRKPSVLFLLPYPLHRAPSQRFRVEAFFELLDRERIPFRASTFLDEASWKVLYQDGSLLQKGAAVLKGFLKRLVVILFTASRYDYIFVHREAAPLGPPVFEWLLAKVFGKKIIFDFDDAIWIPNISESNKIARSVKCFWKVRYICKWAYKVSAGNAFLANYALQYNAQVLVVPTCVDTENRYNTPAQQTTHKPVIGWTGSHSTLKYLDLIVPVLQRLQKEYEFDFLVICDKQPEIDLQSVVFLPWKESSEITDLLRLHIGVMPLEHDAWSEGKCGFKIIQYLSLGIPAVASPVGVNKSIIEHKKNGFLCASEGEWYQVLAKLIRDEQLRLDLGRAGRKQVELFYSLSANANKFLSLFT